MDGIKKKIKGSIISLEPEMVLFLYLNLDLVEAAASTCTLAPEVNANSPCLQRDGAYSYAGTDLLLWGHPLQQS